MPVPCLVFADLVVIEAGLVFGELECFFYGPAGSGDADQLGQRYGVGGVADVVGQLGGVADRAAEEQLVVVISAGVDQEPVIEPVALAARSG